MPDDYWAREREDVLERFTRKLSGATGDGSKKRQAGTKPPWYEDDSHEAAIFSHLNKWKHGECIDAHSGEHTLVHLAWRALAIACQETGDYPRGGEVAEPISYDALRDWREQLAKALEWRVSDL